MGIIGLGSIKSLSSSREFIKNKIEEAVKSKFPNVKIVKTIHRDFDIFTLKVEKKTTNDIKKGFVDGKINFARYNRSFTGVTLDSKIQWE
jgi:hypothetical protein